MAGFKRLARQLWFSKVSHAVKTTASATASVARTQTPVYRTFGRYTNLPSYYTSNT